MRAMEYHIISGSVIETRRCWMPDSIVKVRGQRKAGNSSLAKIRQNERSAVQRLARILNCNFGEGLMLVTLKYADDRLPQDYTQLKKNGSKFIRQLRATARMHKVGLAYVMINANWSPKKDCEARLHHHIVMPVELFPYLDKLWPHGEMHIKRVSSPGDLSTLAAYLIANTNGLDAGENKWVSARGMEKPIYTEPKPVDAIDSIEPVPNTSIVEAVQYVDREEGYITSTYIRAVCHEKIKVRGGQIVLPRKKKKGKMPVTMDRAIWEDDE